MSQDTLNHMIHYVREAIMNGDFTLAEARIGEFKKNKLDSQAKARLSLLKGIIDYEREKTTFNDNLSVALSEAYKVQDWGLVYNGYNHVSNSMKEKYSMIGLYLVRKSIEIAKMLHSEELLFHANCHLAEELYEARDYKHKIDSRLFEQEANTLLDSFPQERILDGEMQSIFDYTFGIVKHDITRLKNSLKYFREKGYNKKADKVQRIIADIEAGNDE